MVATKRWTIEELEREGGPEGRWELIDGELVAVSPSGRGVSKRAAWITYLLIDYVVPRGLGEVYSADSGFVLFPGRDLLRAPDVSFVRTERLPIGRDQSRFLRLAPDLAVEVISPHDQPGEVVSKAVMYLDAGVRLVWVVDPIAKTVAVYVHGQPTRLLESNDELDGGEVLPGFRVSVTRLFI